MAQIKFYRCKHCGNLFATVNDGGVNPVCCGEPMELLEPGAVEAATEKHVPVLTSADDKIVAHVGSVSHPMTPEHYIEWIAMVTDSRICVKRLTPADAPEATFCGKGVTAATVYAYCNLHGLWKTEL